MIKLKNLLVENPDSIHIDGKFLHYDDADTVVFAYHKDKMLVCPQLNFKSADEEIDTIHTMLPIMYGYTTFEDWTSRRAMKFAGRLWYESKIISLWGKYPSRNELNKIITDIKNELIRISTSKRGLRGIYIHTELSISDDKIKEVLNNMTDFNINSKSWRLELSNDNPANVLNSIDSEVVKLLFYKNSNGKQFADVDHVKSPMIKSKKLIPGMGSLSKKYGDETATQHFQKKYTSEIKK